MTLTVSHLIDVSTLKVNNGAVELTGIGNNQYTFTAPADNVTVTAETLSTYSFSLPDNMEIVSTTKSAANKTDYFTITEDGDRRIIMQKDDTDYSVTIDADITGGTVTADKTTAKAGELVTLTVAPASGYGLQSLTVKDASDNDVSVSSRKFIMPKGSVIVSATFIQTTAAFDQATGVLTLNGNVVADEIKAYGAIVGEFGGIDEYSPVTSVVCEPGTVLPADCSELFLNFYNLSDNLTIDLSNADVSGVTNMSKMFGGYCLTTIYVNSAWSMENVTTSDQMFYGCGVLTGGNGTRWEDIERFNGYETAMSSTYAVVDGKNGQKGYLTHKKGTPVITTAPSAKTDLVYNGEEQELITAGTTNFGDFLSYSLDGVTYNADIPTATDAGTYTVYYKVEGSDNWNAVEPQTVEITIKCRVSFDANGGNGTMKDGGVEKDTQYTLPECTFTAPDGKAFDKWQIGDDTENLKSVGDTITITDNTIIKAIYKDAIKYTLVPAKAATCAEKGNIEYYTGSDGNLYTDTNGTLLTDLNNDGNIDMKDIVTAALGHKWNAPTYTWSADNKTCTATKVCANDNTHIETENVNTTYEVTKVATCEEKGTRTYTATFEGFANQTKDVDIEATGHLYGTPSYTWSDDGKSCQASVTCSNDPKHVVTEKATISGKITTPATCKEKGITTYTATFTNTIFATPTKVVADVEKLTTHTPAEAVKEKEVAATCMTAGSYEEVVYCSVCGKELSRETKTVSVPGHDWGEWTVKTPATETTEGVEKRVCKTDASHTETRAIPMLSHTHVLVKVEAKAATCTETGNIEYWTCEGCNKLFADKDGKTEINTEDTVKAKIAHTPAASTKENETAATCENDGSYEEVVKCSICGEEISRKTVTVEALGHDWGEWVQTKVPTETIEGELTRRKGLSKKVRIK